MSETATYALFGLRIRSEVPLSGLPEVAPDGGTDVQISHGPAPAGTHPAGYSLGPAGTLLHVAKVGTFLIRDGREILVAPAAGASERNVRLFLLGSAFGALLHQRGLLPLHANAIEMEGRAVAFCGHSGAGKSTLAAWFHDRGHDVLADDVCVIGFDGEGGPLAYPGIPRLRLWREALEASGRRTGDYGRSFDGMDKYDVPTEREGALRPLPLSAIYLLRQTDGEDEPRAVRLNGVEMIDALVSNTYRGAYLKTIGRTGGHLEACLRVGRQVPVFRAERAWGFERFDEQARFLEAHAREQARMALP
jgi:hypothetical protein